MSELWANNAKSTLASGITNVATSITVADGSAFPSPTGADYCWATLDDGTNIEIVKVTARSTNTMTVTRAQQGTSGVAFSTGARFELRLTAETLEDMQASSGGGALQSDKKTITSGDLTTTSTTFVDVDATNMAITMTTGANRVLITVIAVGEASAGDLGLDIDIDGARQGQTFGLAFATAGSSQNRNLSFSYVTNVLTAASHTFKLQFRSSVGATFTVFASTSVSPLIMSVTELGN